MNGQLPEHPDPANPRGLKIKRGTEEVACPIKSGSWRRTFQGGLPAQVVTYIVPSGLLDEFVDTIFGYWIPFKKTGSRSSRPSLQQPPCERDAYPFPEISTNGDWTYDTAEGKWTLNPLKVITGETGFVHSSQVPMNRKPMHYICGGSKNPSYSNGGGSNSRDYGYFFPVSYSTAPVSGQVNNPVAYNRDTPDDQTEYYNHDLPEDEQDVEHLPGTAGAAHPSIAYVCAGENPNAQLHETALLEVTVNYQPKRSSITPGSTKLIGRDSLNYEINQTPSLLSPSAVRIGTLRPGYDKIIVERGFFVGYTERSSTSVMQIEGFELAYYHKKSRDGSLMNNNLPASSTSKPINRPKIGKDALAGILVSNTEVEVTVENMPAVNYEFVQRFTGKVNEKPFMGYPPESVLYLGGKVKTNYDANGREVYAVTHSFSVKYVGACFNADWRPRMPLGSPNEIDVQPVVDEDDKLVLPSSDDFYSGKIGIWNRRWSTSGEFYDPNSATTAAAAATAAGTVTPQGMYECVSKCTDQQFIRVIVPEGLNPGTTPYQVVDFGGGGIEGIIYAGCPAFDSP